MKARPVKKLDPATGFALAAHRIVAVRLDELCELAGRAAAGGDATDLHDARIAAKRLRYVLETAAPALGRGAAAGARDAKRLQGVLGEIHDCDVLLARVGDYAEQLRGEDSEAVATRAAAATAGPPRDLDPRFAARAPHAARYRGLEALAAYLTARRAILLADFRRVWRRLERRDFRDRLLGSISPPPRPGRPA